MSNLDQMRAELADLERQIEEQRRPTNRETGGRVDDLLVHRARTLADAIAEAGERAGAEQGAATSDAPAEEDAPPNAGREPADVALDFLRRWRAGGPWVLTAIAPDRKFIETRTFTGEDEAACAAWVAGHHGRQNVYFHVNPCVRPLSKKAEREDVAALAWLHVDIDPRVGEDIDAERERALRLLREPPENIPPPTVIVFSGGGYQGFWHLREPLPIDGDLARAEDAKRWNLALELAFGADHCHNIDRIMRLPGTLNIPDAKKRRKGRTETLAELVEWHEDRVYDLGQFTAAPAVAPGREAGTAAASVDTGSVRRLASADELDEWGVPDRVKAIVVKGNLRDVEGPKKGDDSRSGWLFDAVCGLARAGVPDQVIYSVITDRDFGISESVRDKGALSEKYALKQIAAARQEVEPDGGWVETTKNGRPIPSYRNARVAVQRLGVTCEYDVFHNRLRLGGHRLQSTTDELSDHGLSMLRQIVCDEFGFDPAKEHLRDAVVQLCVENTVDPVRIYLDGLVWDGAPRLDGWLADYLGAEATEMNRAIGRLMLIAAVRRVRQPGAKFDTIPVLEGPQGTGKSTALVILAGRENFSDQDILALDAKAQMEGVEGIWIYEICELEGMTRAEVNKVKAFASRQDDRARPAYGRFRENRPRRCIFVGTTNEDQYLRDRTGNRRFLPIRTGEIHLEPLRRDRDQLWAEAAEAEAKGEPIVLPEELREAAAELQSERLEHDPWEDRLAGVKGLPERGVERIRTTELLGQVLAVPDDRWTPQAYKRLGHCMRRLGWSGPMVLRFAGGDVQRGYERPAPGKDTPF